MLVFNSSDELKPYYHKESNTYVFDDDIKFNFNLDVNAHINAYDINARHINAWNINTWNINAYDINARNINAVDIKAININAKNIIYYAVCFAYNSIICKSIQGRKEKHKHFALDGEIIYKQKEKKQVTLELTDEQLSKIKAILED